MNKYDTRKEMSGEVSEEIVQWWNLRQIKIKYNYFIVYWFSRKNNSYLSDITPKF